MLKKSLMLYFFLLSPLLASGQNKEKEIDLSEIFRSSTPVRVLYIPRQETGEELIARNMHQPELWSCSNWLKQERPNFSEKTLSSHPLFTAVKEAMALADFEVDVLTGFTMSVCRPDVQNIISKLDRDDQQNVQDTIFELRKNALQAKYFTANIIDMVGGTVKVEDTLKEFFLNKMIAQIHEVAKLKHKCMMLQSKGNSASKQKRQVVLLAPNGKKTILNPQDPDSIASVLNNAFLRSLNSKLRIMRIFLDDLRSKGKISKDLSDILLLSSSLHPFLNHENDDWVDLDRGEVNDFLGNAAVLGIDLNKLFTKERIQGVSVPKRYTKLSEFSIPKFLLETPDHPSHAKKKKKKKKKAALASANTSAHSSSSAPGSSATSASESSSSSSLESTSVNSFQEPSLPQHPIQDKKDEKKTFVAQAKSTSKADVKRADSHADTIYDIFRPHGYKGLNSDKIITAWESVTQGRGFLKKKTGSSHQPLCVVLSDGTRVIMPFFISGSYGPHYIKHVRDAFEAIGFGKDWLRKLKYKI